MSSKPSKLPTSAPILAHPTDTDLYILDTDASDFSIGSVLSQIQNGKELVISYASRALSTAEKNYSTTKKELLSVTYFVKYFRSHLLGRRFILRSDHAALVWLYKSPDLFSQHARWIEILGEFDFEIQHRKGQLHSNADGLSRIPQLDAPGFSNCIRCRSPMTFCTESIPMGLGN